MANITIDGAARTLRTDALKDHDVTIADVNLKCNSCGENYMLSVPWESGNFPRNWYECPRGCNKVKASKTPAAA
ncbi:MAG: hypothetical protein WDA71_08300 [Actinomycetota bacterium]